MSTIAIIGAGTGLGAAIGRRFGREGFAVALVSRNLKHLDALAATLQGEGFTARGYPADVRRPDQLTAALAAAAAELGTIEVLEYSPHARRLLTTRASPTPPPPPRRADDLCGDTVTKG